MSIDSVIFDLDGTLWDASPAIADAWQAAGRRFGFTRTVTEGDIRAISGLPYAGCVKAIFGDEGVQNAELIPALEKSEGAAVSEKGGRIYEGVEDVIRTLSSQYKIYLVSNCQTWYLDAFKKHFKPRDLLLDAICYGDTNQPKSQNIRLLIERHQLKKPIYIGDTQWDQEAAFSAGAKFVFAAYGFGQTLVTCPRIQKIQELPELLKSFEQTPSIEVRRLAADEFDQALVFYQSVGYRLQIDPQDRYYAAFHAKKIVGLVRLAFEHEHWVLRGMQIEPRYQFFGIGTQLIRLLESELSDEILFCLPHSWLERFYAQIGFAKVTQGLPTFLETRLNEHRRKYPHLIAMRRASPI